MIHLIYTFPNQSHFNLLKTEKENLEIVYPILDITLYSQKFFLLFFYFNSHL